MASNYVSWSEDLPKGTVPNLLGLTSANAATQVTNAGFIGSLRGADIPLNDTGGGLAYLWNTVASQTETSGTVIPLGEVIDYQVYNPYFPPFFPPFFPPHFPPFFPPFFPPHFPPFFPPFFPPHFPPFFPPGFGPYFPPFFPPTFCQKDGVDIFMPGLIKKAIKKNDDAGDVTGE